MAKKNNVKEVVISKTGKDYQEALDKAFKEKQKKTTLPGFRKGKVPYDIYLKKYGQESLYSNIVDNLIDKAYEEGTKEIDLSKVVVKPSVAIKKIDNKEVQFLFTFIFRPDVKINKYKKLGVKLEEVKIKKEDKEKAFNKLVDSLAELKVKDGKVQKKDTVIIDYVGKKDGVPFEHGSAKDYALEIGSNTFIPGFEDELIGLSKNDEKTFKISFPSDYHSEELKGQEVEFTVKIKEVKEKLTRKLDKDFFLDLAIEGVDSKEKLDQYIEKELEKEQEINVKNKNREAIFDALIKNSEMDINDEIISAEVDRLLHSYENQMRQYGMTDFNVHEMLENDSEMKKTLEKEAIRNIQIRFILEKLDEELKIEVLEKEVEDKLKDIMDTYKIDKDYALNLMGGEEVIKSQIRIDKIIDKLISFN